MNCPSWLRFNRTRKVHFCADLDVKYSMGHLVLEAAGRLEALATRMKLLGKSATLVVTRALLVVTRSY